MHHGIYARYRSTGFAPVSPVCPVSHAVPRPVLHRHRHWHRLPYQRHNTSPAALPHHMSRADWFAGTRGFARDDDEVAPETRNLDKKLDLIGPCSPSKDSRGRPSTDPSVRVDVRIQGGKDRIEGRQSSRLRVMDPFTRRAGMPPSRPTVRRAPLDSLPACID